MEKETWAADEMHKRIEAANEDNRQKIAELVQEIARRLSPDHQGSARRARRIY